MAGRVTSIPVPVIMAAASGDSEALAAVVGHYAHYICALSTRPLMDEYGHESLDEDMRLRLESKLVYSIITGFRVLSA